MVHVWLHRFSVLVALCTLLLGRLVPPLEGGIRYEFAHRVLAATVGILSIILAIWLRKVEERAWMRRLGWLLAVAVGAGVATADAPQPMPLMVGFTVAHLAVGSLAFGAAVALVLLVHGQARPAEAELAPGGVAIA
jgi:cytochrome c oxidase assembly protein subunit 15